MYHGIDFYEIGGTIHRNTWDDYFMVPTTRPVVSPPDPKTNYVDINGVNGSLDLSTALTGFMLYDDRRGSWDFMVQNRKRYWATNHQKLMSELHGKRFRVILEDDRYYYYIGRLSINGWDSRKDHSYVKINYVLQPYKYELQSSISPWLWDPFNFETGIIRDYRNLAVNGTLVLEVPGSSRPYAPTFQATAAMTVTTSGGTEYELLAGENVFGDLMIGPAGETLTFSGNGTVSVVYQGAWL